MNTNKISKKALSILKKDGALRMKIALATNKSEGAIRYWVRTNSELLTLTTVVSVIQRETGLTDAELYEKSKVPA